MSKKKFLMLSNPVFFLTLAVFAAGVCSGCSEKYDAYNDVAEFVVTGLTEDYESEIESEAEIDAVVSKKIKAIVEGYTAENLMDGVFPFRMIQIRNGGAEPSFPDDEEGGNWTGISTVMQELRDCFEGKFDKSWFADVYLDRNGKVKSVDILSDIPEELE